MTLDTASAAAETRPGQNREEPPLARLLAPRAVAVLGVSEDSAKLGSKVLANLIGGGFTGSIFPVHNRAAEIQGLACVSDAADLPSEVDVAFVALPAAATLLALEQLAAAGVRYAIVGSAGYAEGGDQAGIARQAAISALAASSGMRIVGPNCNGVYGVHSRLALGFNTGHARRLRPGGLAILSHSGALFDLMARRVEAVGGGLSFFVSAGNEADLNLLDYLEHAIADPATRVIALLLDALTDAARFRRLAALAHAAGKPIVALKLGASELGAAAAVAHSSRLVGSADAYSAFLHACGVATVETLDGLVTAGALLDRVGRRQGGIAGFSTSGAGAALIADHAASRGVPVPDYAESTHRALESSQRFSRLMNPTDMGVFGGAPSLESVFTTIMADPGIGLFLGLLHSIPPRICSRMAGEWQRAAAITGTPVVLFAPGDLPAEERRVYEDAGIILLADTGSTFEAVGALFAKPARPAEAQRAAGPPVLARGAMLTEAASLRLLAEHGVPVVRCAECGTREQAQHAAQEMGFPVVLKGVAEGVAHKSEAGLVQLDLASSDAVGLAFDRVKTDRVIVQQQVKGDIEVMIGVTRSPDVGLIMVAGLGGIFVEALAQTITCALPIGRETIGQQLAASTLGRVLTSPRWPHAGTFEALIDTLMAVQAFALQAGDDLAALDINPLVATAGGIVAVDALVIPADPQLARGCS